MKKYNALSHTRYVLAARLSMPAGAFVLLIFIGQQSDVLLGGYALATTFFFIMQTLPLLGLTTLVMREVARDASLATTYVYLVGSLSILGCLGMNLLVYLFLPHSGYSDEVQSAIQVVGLVIFPGILAFLAEIVLTSLHQARQTATIAIIENSLRVVCSVAVLLNGGGLVDLMWVLLFTRLGAFLAYLRAMYLLDINPYKHPPDMTVLGKISQLLPVFLLNALLMMVISRLDFVMLSFYDSLEAIGYYAIGYRLFEISMMVISAIIMAAFPSISRRFIGSQKHFIVAVKILLLLFVIGLLVIVYSGFVLADSYVALLFSKQYPNPVLLTQLFMLVFVLAGLDYAGAAILHASDQQRQDTRALFVGAITYAISLWWLVPLWSIYGALVSLVISTTAQGVIRYYYIAQHFDRLLTSGELLRLLLGGLIFLVLCSLSYQADLWFQLLILLPLGFLALPMILLITGVFSPLRWTRYFWKTKHASDVDSFSGLIDHIVLDARRVDLWQRYQSLQEGADVKISRKSVFVTLLYRLSRYFLLGKKYRLSSFLSWLVHTFAKCRLSADMPMGAGLVLVAPQGISISCPLGNNTTIYPSVIVSCLGDKDIGCGPGVPAIGNGTTLGKSSLIIGAVIVDDKSNIQPGSKLNVVSVEGSSGDS